MDSEIINKTTKKPVRVFISYAWEDDDYFLWVAQLAAQLRKDGVDARLDRWHMQPGQTIPDFMNSEIRHADKVLMLCSPIYREKVHAMEDGGIVTGSGWESMVLSSAMFTQSARHKVVTAVARGEWEQSAPDYLQALPYDNLTQTVETKLRRAYTALVQRLTDTTETVPVVELADNLQVPDSVPPLFGERIIINKSESLATDRSTLPPLVTLPIPHRMPYRSLGERFAGRVEALWNLHDLLGQKKTAVVSGVGVVAGTGGLGKTQLAIEYVHRFGNNYPGGVFWTDAEQGLAVVVKQIARSEGIDIDSGMPVDNKCEVLWQTLEQKQEAVLIVFDNFPETEALRPWLPPGMHLKVLVTTRRRDLAYSRVRLSFMTSKEGLDLLNSVERSFGDEAIPLIDTLGGLPLALELACNFLNQRPELDIDALLVVIDKPAEQLTVLDLFTEQYKNELPTGHEKAVSRTFLLSWDLASENEQKLLKLMSFWAPSPVPRRLLKRAMNNTSGSVFMNPVDSGIAELGRLSLVELDEGCDPQIHRLLLGFVRTQINKNEYKVIKAQAVNAVKMELSRTRDESDTAALTELEKVLLHGQAVLDSNIAESKQAIDIANYISWHQRHRGRYQLAKDTGLQALALAQKSYAPDHTKIAICQTYLGLVLKDLGDFEGAKTLLTDALASAQQHFEPGHPRIATWQSNLALVLKDLGELEGAKTLLTDALASAEQNFDPGHPRIATRQSNLALVLKDCGDLEGAKTLLTDALAMDQQHFELGHPSIATSQSNLALVLQKLGDLEGAKTLLTDALAMDQQHFELGHPRIATSQSNLGLVLKELGDLEGAKTLFTEVLTSAKQSFEPGHPRIATRQSNLGLVLQDLGDLEGAKTLLTDALASGQQNFEPGHPSIATRQSKLAGVLQDLGDLEGAKTLLTDALASAQQHFEPGHPRIATWQSNLALVLKDLGELEGAKTLLTDALASAEQNFDPGHPRIATRQSNLALVLKDCGDLEGAKTLLTDALAMDQQHFELGHPSIATSQSKLAGVLQDLGDLEGAKTLLTDALVSSQQNFEPGHPRIARSQSNLALLLKALGGLEGAKTLLTEALASDQQSFEPGHPEIAIKQSNLAGVLQDLGDLEGAKTLLIDALASSQQSFEPGHPSIATRQSKLAGVLQDLGDLEGAKTLLVDALASSQQNFEPGHSEIARSQSKLARVLQDLGDLEGAKTLLIDSYEALKNLLGENHPNSLIVKGNLEAVEAEMSEIM